MKGYKIEICANSSESAIIAQRSGADRVELCAGMPEGGTTPSFGEIAAARTKLKRTKLHVIIRPRGGDFCYSPAEIRIMTNDIKMASSLNVDGFVFGCLTPDGDVDSAAMKKLMKAKGTNEELWEKLDSMQRKYNRFLMDRIRFHFGRCRT